MTLLEFVVTQWMRRSPDAPALLLNGLKPLTTVRLAPLSEIENMVEQLTEKVNTL